MKVCHGFLDDARHLENHFFWLTEVKILDRIEKSLPGELANIEAFLVSTMDSLEFVEQLSKVKDECALDFRGSDVHKYIFLLVKQKKSIVVFKLLYLEVIC